MLVGLQVRVHWDERLVRVHARNQCVAVHSRSHPGTYATREQHRLSMAPARPKSVDSLGAGCSVGILAG